MNNENNNNENKNEINKEDNIKQKRNYKSEIKDGYLYYKYTQKRILKDGTVKNYNNTIRKKRVLKKMGKPENYKNRINYKTKINKLIKIMNEEQIKELYEYILKNY